MNEPNVNPNRKSAVLNLELVTKIGQSIARGLTEEQACMAHKVKLDTFRKACQRNEEYGEALQIARSLFLEDATTRIYAGTSGWQGAAWILERRHKAQFARTEMMVTQAAPAGGVTESFLEELAKVNSQLVHQRNGN
jgi:hypothetical protein